MICERIRIWSAQSPVFCHLREVPETPSSAMQSYIYVHRSEEPPQIEHTA